MNRRWLVKRTNPEYINYISKAASVSPAFAQVLINRGMKTPQEISDFLNPRASDFSDPYELKGVKTVLERINRAVSENEKVLVSGDYDADGLTATAIMVHSLRMLGLDVRYFIPNRIAHGYGFGADSVKLAKEINASLIITVDCGITAFDTVLCAKKEGIDVIITDHHEPAKSMIQDEKEHESCIMNRASFKLPDAVAVINPKINSFASGEPAGGGQISNLSGAGIAFKISQALDLEFETLHSELLSDLAAIGTMADVVPLKGENRVIVREGLRLIQDARKPGIKALRSISGLNGREIKSGLLSYTIIPRINAAGRVADAGEIVRLLLSDNEEEAGKLSAWINDLNSERQRIEEDAYQEALEKLKTEGFDSVIVLSDEKWHQGVVGIVASRLAEEFYRPAFVLSVKDGIAKGSARSIPAFDICNGLSECRELLLSFGGHKQAAGIKLDIANIRAFRDRMQDIIVQRISKGDLTPFLEIDADVSLTEVNHSLVKELEMLEPLGCGNEEPYFASKGLEVTNPRIVGNNHLKMRLGQGSQSIDAIGFDMGGHASIADNPSGPVDAVFTPAINEWEGGRYLQLNIKALRPSKGG